MIKRVESANPNFYTSQEVAENRLINLINNVLDASKDKAPQAVEQMLNLHKLYSTANYQYENINTKEIFQEVKKINPETTFAIRDIDHHFRLYSSKQDFALFNQIVTEKLCPQYLSSPAQLPQARQVSPSN